MFRARAVEEFNKNRKIIIREVPPVNYDEVKQFMGKFVVSEIVISKRQRHAIVTLKHGSDAEQAIEYLKDKKLINTEVKSSLFRLDHLLCLENLPREWGNEELKSFASPYGGVEKSFIMVDDEEASLGYGFVEFVHNKELSDAAREKIDRSVLPSGHLVRCRFVKDHVTSFDQLKSCCLVVTNLPLEIGLEKFYKLVLHFGGGTIRPIRYQVGMTTGATMEKFGAAEFESHDFARIMQKKIDGNSYPIGGGEESKASNSQSGTELRASFCTPGESIDDIMKNMTSITATQAKQFAASQSGPNPSRSHLSKGWHLVHPDIHDRLNNDSKALNEFVAVLEKMGSKNKDASQHLNKVEFQTAVLAMMFAMKNPNNNLPYNHQNICNITTDLLKSISSNSNSNNPSNNENNKPRQQNRTFQNRNGSSFNDLESTNSCSAIGQGSISNHQRNTSPLDCLSSNQTSFDFHILEELKQTELFYSEKVHGSTFNKSSSSSSQPLSSSAAEFTPTWNSFPSFNNHPLSLAGQAKNEEEPYPGFYEELASVIRSLPNENVLPPPPPERSFANDGPSRLQLASKFPEPRFSSVNSLANQANFSLPSNFNFMINPHTSFQYDQFTPSHSFQTRPPNHDLRHVGPWNPIGQPTYPSSQSVLSRPKELKLDSGFFNKERVPTPPGFELQMNDMANSKKKKYRPKVVEKCWNGLENEGIAMLNQRKLSSPIQYDVSSAKKRKALSENNNNVGNINSNVSLVVGQNKTNGAPHSSTIHPPSHAFNTNLASPSMFPVSELDSVGDATYVGQHQQGLGGEYVDSLLRKRKFREALDAQFKKHQ